MWKFWLGVALLIGWIVVAQIENGSDRAQFHRQRALDNAANSVYTDTIENCDPTLSTSNCSEEAADNARKAKERIGPLLGR